MGRKAYKADLQQAVQGVDIEYISRVRPGVDDAEFSFEFVLGPQGPSYEICAYVQGKPHCLHTVRSFSAMK
jgi:hypothetical protein